MGKISMALNVELLESSFAKIKGAVAQLILEGANCSPDVLGLPKAEKL
jgi:hypothetical protein